MFTDILKIEPQDIYFKVYFIENDKLLVFNEIFDLEAEKINIEAVFSHRDKDEITISFKNFEEYLLIKQKYIKHDVVFSMLMKNQNNEYVQVQTFFMEDYNEEHFKNQFSCSIKCTDWKGFVEDKRMVYSNQNQSLSVDANNFNKIEFGANTTLVTIFSDVYKKFLIDGAEPSKGFNHKYRDIRKIPLLKPLNVSRLKSDITIGDYFLADPMFFGELRNTIIDNSIGNAKIGSGYYQFRPIVKCNIVNELKQGSAREFINLFEVSYTNQTVFKIFNGRDKYKFNQAQINFEKADMRDGILVNSDKKDKISFYVSYPKSPNRLCVTDLESINASLDGDIHNLQGAGSREIGANYQTEKMKLDVDFNKIPLLDYRPGDILAFFDFELFQKDPAFEIKEISLASNHENGYYEFKITDTFDRENVWRYN